ncbi:hypothetical protein CDAR_20441 [Caerostris darwini]|uniref:Uncharacterized protein n=1 Tax=Caerostris darwini TaxID=1538125 RepID=A0AAV4QGP8_9ARAC|nr:hypothetical protein CDAR_20441 [Caerostris darwini]
MNTQRLVEDAAFAIWTFYCTLKGKVKDSKRQQIAIWKLKLIERPSPPHLLQGWGGREGKKCLSVLSSTLTRTCEDNAQGWEGRHWIEGVASLTNGDGVISIPVFLNRCVAILKWPYFNGVMLGPHKMSPSNKLQYATAGRKGLNKNSWAAGESSFGHAFGTHKQIPGSKSGESDFNDETSHQNLHSNF